MVDPHRETKKESRRHRLRAWFLALGIKGKTITLLSGIAFLLLLIFGIVAISLTIKSLTSDDLSLYLAASTPTLALHPGDAASVTVEMSAKNLPFCTAECFYTATDHLAGVVIAKGDVTLRSSIEQSLTIPYTAPATYERDGLITVTLTCANNPSNLCKSDGTARYSTATVRVLSRYTDEQLAARDQFMALLTARRDELAAWQAYTDALSRRVDDRRVTDIVEQARTDATTLSSALALIAAAASRENYRQAASLLVTLEQPSSLSRYDAARTAELAAVADFARIATMYTNTTQLAPLLNASNAALLATVPPQLMRVYSGFASSDLAVTARLLGAADTTLVNATVNLSEGVNTILVPAESGLARDETLRCALYGSAVACPVVLPDTNSSSLQRLTAYCAAANSAADRFMSSRLLYARDALADPNATIADALAALNVSDVASAPTFTVWRTTTIDLLRAGSVVSLTPAETLALNPIPVPSAINCSLGTPIILSVPNATLPLLDPVVGELPLADPIPRQCCDDGQCVACPAEQATPIVFVHGFSFAQGTSPESNLNAFGPLAQWLDTQNTARYVGHIFPQENIAEGSLTSLTGLPGRYGMTATYYYDSYSQDGKLSLVAQKTENLETYAIRLREAIEVAKSRTGEDKVIIVAHSMGGLVTRRYLQLFGEDSVVAVIMIGTPNKGISGRTQQFCGVLGSALECRDMEEGSLFMTKLTNGKKPTVPVYTIAGVGCDTSGNEGDGVITQESVELSWATNMAFNGSCSGLSALHSTLLDPALYPDVAETVEGLLQQY